MARILTPEPAQIGKSNAGITDVTMADGMYKFMGCRILSLNMSLGFNGTASSVSLTLVEDKEKGDRFIEPLMGTLWAVSLPKGGIGVPVVYDTPLDLTPESFYPANTPFYFSGLCSNWSRSLIDMGGKTISVTLVDPREILNGIQCLMSGFALSQEVGVGNRSLGVKNVIDIFGYWDYGMESGRNEYGMQWHKIRDVIQRVRVTIHDMHYEFVFTGQPFFAVPEWYRIDEQITDISSLCQRVAEDSGSDYITIGRKISANEMVVEIRGLKRTNYNPLTKGEISRFVQSRKDIIDTVRTGQEFKNEPTSSVIIGGMKNSNYLALPSTYDESMHLTEGYEDYNAFPADIKTRLFGGSDSFTGKSYNVQSGSIFPFWGFTPDDHAYPLIEPFLSLDHMVFDRDSVDYGEVTSRIPACKISVKSFKVRANKHQDVFIPNDGNSDSRPFAYLETYLVGAKSVPYGYLRGLPLNTEVLRAALVSEIAFYDLYRLYYPDIAEALGMYQPDLMGIYTLIDSIDGVGLKPDLRAINIDSFMFKPSMVKLSFDEVARDENGEINKIEIEELIGHLGIDDTILTKFRTLIYEYVRQYASDHMGTKFIVALPQSAIMQRIWLNLPVPTRPERPEIEYMIDQTGYWETLPAEFDAISGKKTDDENDGNIFSGSEEDQIRRKFMAEDGRFSAMTVIEWQPKGNINFNSNGHNRAMFQDLPTSEFRPNKIASGNPKYVFVSCTLEQLVKRPDLAVLTLPSPISFDPTVGNSYFSPFVDVAEITEEFIVTKTGIMNYFGYIYKMNKILRDLVERCAIAQQMDIEEYAVRVFREWAEQMYNFSNEWYKLEMSTEPVMDLKGVVIPLTSTWVAYGPWYANYSDAKGMVSVEVDDSLVPWNFERSDGDWDDNLNAAGNERLARSLSVLEYLDTASISVAGFPEFGPAHNFGYNSNVTGISIDFGIGGVKTTYNLATYSQRPGTFRKAEYDNVSRARIDTRERLPDTVNENLTHMLIRPYERNRFPN